MMAQMIMIMPEPVLTLREAYSKLQRLQEDDLVDELVSKIEKKIVEKKLRELRQKLLEDFYNL